MSNFTKCVCLILLWNIWKKISAKLVSIWLYQWNISVTLLQELRTLLFPSNISETNAMWLVSFKIKCKKRLGPLNMGFKPSYSTGMHVHVHVHEWAVLPKVRSRIRLYMTAEDFLWTIRWVMACREGIWFTLYCTLPGTVHYWIYSYVLGTIA